MGEKGENIMSHFQNAFGDTPENKAVRDLEAALAEARHERI